MWEQKQREEFEVKVTSHQVSSLCGSMDMLSGNVRRQDKLDNGGLKVHVEKTEIMVINQ